MGTHSVGKFCVWATRALLLLGDAELLGEDVVEDGCGKESLHARRDLCVGAYEDSGWGAWCDDGADDLFGGSLDGRSVARGLCCESLKAVEFGLVELAGWMVGRELFAGLIAFGLDVAGEGSGFTDVHADSQRS